MQVSVPGMYQNPAPYSEQILTYSMALAFTGRSAALALLMTASPVAEPRIIALKVVMSLTRFFLQRSLAFLLDATGILPCDSLSTAWHLEVQRDFDATPVHGDSRRRDFCQSFARDCLIARRLISRPRRQADMRWSSVRHLMRTGRRDVRS